VTYPRPHERPGQDLPPLYDPYAAHPAAAPNREPGKLLAIAALVLSIFGPLGVVFALGARREIKRGGGRQGLATAALVLSSIMSLAWVAGGIGAAMFTLARTRMVAQADRDPDPSHPPPLPIALPSGAPSASPMLGTTPKATGAKKIGAITLVDVGVQSSSLQEELSKQRAEAASANETMLLMTVTTRCEPCRGFEKSLEDARLQDALTRVRIVRVDTEVFREDLDAMKVPWDRVPGFFLLGVDLTPKDGIDGGEWDDDIPQNIAPVISAFVRGKYATRRQPWKPQRSGKGISI
jgi:hypothetical protein